MQNRDHSDTLVKPLKVENIQCTILPEHYTNNFTSESTEIFLEMVWIFGKPFRRSGHRKKFRKLPLLIRFDQQLVPVSVAVENFSVYVGSYIDWLIRNHSTANSTQIQHGNFSSKGNTNHQILCKAIVYTLNGSEVRYYKFALKQTLHNYRYS